MEPKNRVYLDYAAATPLDETVKKAMEPYLADEFANPSSLYAEGRAARLALKDSRKRIAKVLGARVGEIVLTAGGTEAVNLAIQGVQKSYPQGKILALESEHQAVLESVKAAGGKLISVKKNGRLNRDRLEKLMTDDVVMICAAQVNSELGTVQPLTEIAALIAQLRQDRKKRGVAMPLYLLSDSSAAAGHLSLQVSRLGVDLMVLNGGKIYGPKQTGALYVRHGVNLSSIILGGGQERGLRSGTEAVSQAVGLALALEQADGDRHKQEKRHVELRKILIDQLSQIPGFALNNPQHSLPGIVNFRIDGTSGEDLVYRLDAAGFAVATGAACSASSAQPSHVLLAIGLSREAANASLRLSFGRTTTAQELTDFVAALCQLI